jgi:hypothetical protein
LDVVEVSGTNQYKVSPAELVTTSVPLIVLLASAVPEEPDDAPAVAAVLVAAGVEELDELAHAATSSTAMTRLVTAHRFLIRKVFLPPCGSPLRDHVPPRDFVHLPHQLTSGPGGAPDVHAISVTGEMQARDGPAGHGTVR